MQVCSGRCQEHSQCFTPAEPGHNSSAASHTVRTPSGPKPRDRHPPGP
ncbi:hypothetical protein SFR_1476 [Streptomyces sp. FR-008]|nr:hypothetical protein SFR_1476 [Streptomyces sp. FR-008]